MTRPTDGEPETAGAGTGTDDGLRERGSRLASQALAVAGRNSSRLLAGAVAVAAGVAVFVLATRLFPYHSINHDEGVYLQQAAMLLEGQLRLRPPGFSPGGGPAGLEELFRPWFFVADDAGYYPKYSPVPAAIFALGKLAGGYRLALAAVAAGNVALVYGVAAAAFDRRTGVLAAVALAAAPTFLFTAAAFLSYAPTTLSNLTFALAYVRAVRRDHLGYAALAGTATGIAFFSRPFTAVLFAAPFILHALWTVWRALASGSGTARGRRRVRTLGDDRPRWPPAIPRPVLRNAVTAAFGLAFVALALAYNAVLTGSALTFPYEAFAPLDGLGFGQRRMLHHDLVYTPEIAFRANAAVLRRFALNWFAAGALGTGLAILGAVAAVARIARRRSGSGATGRPAAPRSPLPDDHLRLLLLGVAASVIAGNVYFWGNYNVIGGLDEPGGGLAASFGPFYHFDLLLPLSAFAAHAVVGGTDAIRARLAERWSPGVARAALLAGLALTLPVAGAAEAAVLGPPLERNAVHTEKLEGGYEPIAATEFENGLVFIPPAYGDWQNHPFQWLRNDPGFDGPVVYALDRGPDDDFAAIEAFPDRQYYRYTYRGTWTPDPAERVDPRLVPLEVRSGDELAATTTVGVPDRIVGASATISNGETVARYDHEGELPSALAVNWTITPDGVALSDSAFVPRYGDDAEPVPITGADEVAVTVTITEPSGGTLTYRQEVTLGTVDEGTAVEVVWPPERSTCTLVTDCGLDGTYLPDAPETRPDGSWMNTSLSGDG